MTNIDSSRGVFTQHINKEYESIAKTNFKRQPGKNSPTKSTISNSIHEATEKKTFSDTMRNHICAGGEISHHMFLKNVRGKEKQHSETHC